LTVSLVTVPNVPLLEAGVEYNLSNGPTTFTPEDLADAVTAANEDPSVPAARIKLGHVDPRYNDMRKYDGSPSFGKAINLRLSDNGMVVYGDLVGVPKWLADVMATAYPGRSIEGFRNADSHAGKKWRFVISACSLLGVVWPGITQLEDLPALGDMFGEQVPAGVRVIDNVAASQPGGDSMRVNASANLDDVRRAFYQDIATDETQWWWVRAVMTDPNELVVEDDESGQLFKLSYSSDDDGAVTFGEAQPVRIDYIPDNRESLKAAASHVAATLAIGRQVLASWSTRAESSPEPEATGGTMDAKAIRTRLGLPEDASDEQVKAALRELNAVVNPVAETTEDDDDDGDEGDEGDDEEETESVVTTVAASNLPPGTVLIDQATLDALKAGAATATQLKEQQDSNTRESLVSAAIADGRVAPARKEHWLNALKADPGASQVLASLETGLVPVVERGHGHAPDIAASLEADEDLVTSWSEQLFPEIRQQNAEDFSRRSRISTDARHAR
jgi:hypothetical protein